jgi:hypothetical protein
MPDNHRPEAFVHHGRQVVLLTLREASALLRALDYDQTDLQLTPGQAADFARAKQVLRYQVTWLLHKLEPIGSR